MNRAYVAQEDLGEMNKEFQRKERKLKCDVSELQIALRDAKHENSLLTEQVLEMQEQMESERKDRTRWATARLKLLAEFCDEESYQRSVTEDTPLISSPPRRRAKGRRTPRNNMMDDESYDGDDSDKEARQRRNSIVFG
ncbi:uncharacterized protein IUM83_01871 [Phytophthora cinnamomi]|uniref:uncharacterized protein n=1 Tax=Phytophthora cinnamomi TaxID=4785 RepID=UPI00355999DA|nr:hypothetical protein IUM83_01871 [Phytophthora cinnamomi]